MKITKLFFFAVTLFSFFSFSLAYCQSGFIYGDLLPDAPELAARGKFRVGVQTLNLVNMNQIDVIHSRNGKDSIYNRPLTVEVWYPATIAPDKQELIEYEEVMGSSNDPKRPLIPFKFRGRALRNAPADKTEGPYPLLIVSHGYLGSRFLLTYLTENLASKGYIVVAIDHTESTFRDAASFASTLLNRSLDDLFVLNEISRLGKRESKTFLSGLVNADNTALIGYSMGGYGALNAAGAGYSPQAVKFFGQMTGGSKALEKRMTGNVTTTLDSRIRAIVAFAPWGMERGIWDAEGLKGLKVPTFFVAGSLDDISGYEKGIKAIYDGALNADRYLLTYINARHNVAPNPPPAEALAAGLPLDEYLRYAEPAWDERRINNINQHFVTAFLGIQLKGLDFKKYLQLKENSNEATWTGFKPRTSVGLELKHSTP
ncbi:alpha/beta hydrolase family protein [Runella slithyformis]|uniref:Dienelactone hydrolase-like protein n=1 Tax=Runella slithyformis (strain ATCC 29530 / DSM 19594 / LMG 11500 / NCIMB 11436 / LSU 4) TaxID=761193 RepID=A0A7U3ZN26_RUNSL|nr:dienelactone hydrolase [Runella slithyformis]AEI50240.1 dienelactone hydrolase-like protein [Runella slithyformis DSM 19594]